MNKHKQRCRALRHRMSDAERRLWRYLRNRALQGWKFRRQHAIGPFIADFACPELRLVIELDGGQHLAQQDYDARRTRYLQRQGWRVLRFWNHEVFNALDAVLRQICEVAGPHPSSLPQAGEGAERAPTGEASNK